MQRFLRCSKSFGGCREHYLFFLHGVLFASRGFLATCASHEPNLKSRPLNVHGKQQKWLDRNGFNKADTWHPLLGSASSLGRLMNFSLTDNRFSVTPDTLVETLERILGPFYIRPQGSSSTLPFPFLSSPSLDRPCWETDILLVRPQYYSPQCLTKLSAPVTEQQKNHRNRSSTGNGRAQTTAFLLAQVEEHLGRSKPCTEWATPPSMDIYVRSRDDRGGALPPNAFHNMNWDRVGVLHVPPALPLPARNFQCILPKSRQSAKKSQLMTDTEVQYLLSGTVVSLAAMLKRWGLLSLVKDEPRIAERGRAGKHSFHFPPPSALMGKQTSNRQVLELNRGKHCRTSIEYDEKAYCIRSGQGNEASRACASQTIFRKHPPPFAEVAFPALHQQISADHASCPSTDSLTLVKERGVGVLMLLRPIETARGSARYASSSCFTMVCHTAPQYRHEGSPAIKVGRPSPPGRKDDFSLDQRKGSAFPSFVRRASVLHAFIHAPTTAPIKSEEANDEKCAMRPVSTVPTRSESDQPWPSSFLVYVSPVVLSGWLKQKRDEEAKLKTKATRDVRECRGKSVVHKGVQPSELSGVVRLETSCFFPASLSCSSDLYGGSVMRSSEKKVKSAMVEPLNHRAHLQSELQRSSKKLLMAYLYHLGDEGTPTHSSDAPVCIRCATACDEVQLSPFPSPSVLLRNYRWRRDPHTLAQEMKYGAVEMFHRKNGDVFDKGIN